MSAELLDALAIETTPEPAKDTIHWLVDNAFAYDALLSAIGGARRSVWISQLAFDADCLAYDDAAGLTDDRGRRIIDAVMHASRERAVDVRILLNASLLLDTAAPLRAFLRHQGAHRVQVRGIRQFPQLLHAKVVVIDGREAFLVGSPFANGYWDDSRHEPQDARRPTRELGGRPVHDLSCQIMGPAVMALEEQFVELWNEVSVSPEELRRIPVVSHAPSPGAIRVARTTPRRVLPAHPHGLTEILSELQRGLGEARSLVYVEHQYLSARPVIDALVSALEREPSLEVIVVLNQNPDVTAYRGWQNARIRETGLLRHPRVGMFALWSMRTSPGSRHQVNQLFVHSKVLLVDDVWATVGSANLDGVSLHSYGDDFGGIAGRRVFRHVRNFDVNVTFDDRDEALSGAVRDLRLRLWSEHLGLEARCLAARPDGGWLPLWRACAARNVAALSNGRGRPHSRGNVLPYSMRSTPREQLVDLGVDPNGLEIVFDPSWLEVQCSPNWVRNMFA